MGTTCAANACSRTRPAPPPAARLASPLKLGLKATAYSTWSGWGSGSMVTASPPPPLPPASDFFLPPASALDHAGAAGAAGEGRQCTPAPSCQQPLPPPTLSLTRGVEAAVAGDLSCAQQPQLVVRHSHGAHGSVALAMAVLAVCRLQGHQADQATVRHVRDHRHGDAGRQRPHAATAGRHCRGSGQEVAPREPATRAARRRAMQQEGHQPLSDCACQSHRLQRARACLLPAPRRPPRRCVCCHQPRP